MTSKEEILSILEAFASPERMRSFFFDFESQQKIQTNQINGLGIELLNPG